MGTAVKKAERKIEVLGARVHNLKNIDVSIPRNKLTVITGLSGSGKSSLAFDTIYAEGQRRYMESLSSYAKRFIAQSIAFAYSPDAPCSNSAGWFGITRTTANSPPSQRSISRL